MSLKINLIPPKLRGKFACKKPSVGREFSLQRNKKTEFVLGLPLVPGATFCLECNLYAIWQC